MRLSPITRDRVLIQVVLILGTVLLLYPSAADWFSSRLHNSEVSGYVQAMEQSAPEVRQDLLEEATNYNDRLPRGPLRDPYSFEDNAEDKTTARRAYEGLLQTSTNAVVGNLVYSAAGVDLPVYHGTSEETLARGVGHLYGSSMPIGGPGTHSVLTSHSGLVNATLFSNLPTKSAVGDEFSVDVLGEKHYYRVDQIRTVLPDESESLRITEGEDHITLITCTPIGINTHRLLVRGTRIPAPPEPAQPGFWVPGDGIVAGFPWWAVGMLVGVVLSFAAFATRSPTMPAPEAASPPLTWRRRT